MDDERGDMMRVKDTNIYLTRGDTASITLDIQFEAQFEIKKVFFTIKKSAESSAILIQKKWISEGGQGGADLEDGIIKTEEEGLTPESNVFIVQLENDDTANKKFGQYRYDVQVNYVDTDDPSNERILTVVKPSIFSLEEEVTENGVSA